MKHPKQSLFLLSFIVLLIACNEAPKKEKATEQPIEEATANPGQAAITAYLELKDALVESSTEKAKVAATKLKELLSTNEAVSAQAASIIESNEIEAQRAAFELVSVAVYEEVKTQGTGVELYKQFCPMAFDDKGAFWLSDAKEIKNPYFGSMMLKCGSVEETIAAK